MIEDQIRFETVVRNDHRVDELLGVSQRTQRDGLRSGTEFQFELVDVGQRRGVSHVSAAIEKGTESDQMAAGGERRVLSHTGQRTRSFERGFVFLLFQAKFLPLQTTAIPVVKSFLGGIIDCFVFLRHRQVCRGFTTGFEVQPHRHARFKSLTDLASVQWTTCLVEDVI